MIGPGTIGIHGHSQDFFVATGKTEERERKKNLDCISYLLTRQKRIYTYIYLFCFYLAFLTLCSILLNTFWGVIFFTSLDKGRIHKKLGPGIVVVSHMIFSCVVSSLSSFSFF